MLYGGKTRFARRRVIRAPIIPDRIEWRSKFLVEHELFGKPVSTFPDHALDSKREWARRGNERVDWRKNRNLECLFWDLPAHQGVERGKDQIRPGGVAIHRNQSGQSRFHADGARAKIRHQRDG